MLVSFVFVGVNSCHATECGDLFAVLYLLCLVLHMNGMFDGGISLVPSFKPCSRLSRRFNCVLCEKYV